MVNTHQTCKIFLAPIQDAIPSIIVTGGVTPLNNQQIAATPSAQKP